MAARGRPPPASGVPRRRRSERPRSSRDRGVRGPPTPRSLRPSPVGGWLRDENLPEERALCSRDVVSLPESSVTQMMRRVFVLARQRGTRLPPSFWVFHGNSWRCVLRKTSLPERSTVRNREKRRFLTAVNVRLLSMALASEMEAALWVQTPAPPPQKGAMTALAQEPCYALIRSFSDLLRKHLLRTYYARAMRGGIALCVESMN